MKARTQRSWTVAWIATTVVVATASAQELQEDFNTATGTPGATVLDGSGQVDVEDFDSGLTGENAFAGSVGNSQVTATAQGTTTGGVGGTGAAQISIPSVSFNLLAQDFGGATGTGGGGFVPPATPDAFGFTTMIDDGLFNVGAFGGTFNGAVINGSISAQGLPGGGIGGTGSAQVDVASASSPDWFAGLQFEMGAFPGAAPVFNPGFDGAEGGASLDNWEVFSAGFNVNAETDISVSVPGSLKLFGQFNGDGNASGVFQRLAAQPGQIWEIDAFSHHITGDALVGTSNEVIMKVEFLDASETVLLEDEAVILDATSPLDTWIDNTPLAVGPAPAGTVEVRPVILFLQTFSADAGAGWVDNVSFKLTGGPNPVDLTALELTADVRGIADAGGEIAGDYQLRIEDELGNRLIFSETANGSFQMVGGFLSTATDADQNGVPTPGAFNEQSASYNVVLGFENGTWGTGGTLELDNLFLPSDDPSGSSWFAGLYWNNLAVTEATINDLSLTADILGDVIGGGLQLRLECFKTILAGVDEAFSDAVGDGGADPFLSSEAVAGGQTFGDTLTFDSGITGARAFGGVFGDGTSTGGFFASAPTVGGNPGAFARVRAEDMIFAGGGAGGWFGGFSWGGQQLASTDLSQVTIMADVKGLAVSGGGVGEVELRLEDGEGDRLFFCTVATGAWQTIGGSLDTATFGDSFTGGNGQFDLDAANYTLAVAFSNETPDQLGCDEANSNPWSFGGELQVDNVFITPADVNDEIGRVTFTDTATGAFESVGGNLSTGNSTFGDFDEGFATATGTGGKTSLGGNVDDWDEGIEGETMFYGTFGDAATGDGATASACLSCGTGGSAAGQLVASNNTPGTGGWFSGLFWADQGVDLSAAIDGGQGVLTDVFLTADIRGEAGAGETLGTYSLRIEDSDLTGLTFDVTADGSFQSVGGPLSDAMLVDIDPGTSDGMFNFGQDTYTVTVAVLGTSGNWGPGATITVDNLFFTGVSLGDADTCTVAVAFDQEIDTWLDNGEITVDNINLMMADNSCMDAFDCGDQDDDGIRDDQCTWHECVDGACTTIQKNDPADMGGQFGACPPDGTADGNDRFLALGCFSGNWPGVNACEVATPTPVINVDAGGQFGDCALDGTCDGNDAFAALNAFGGVSSCTALCAGGPAPVIDPEIAVVGRTGVTLKSSATHVRPGDLVHVDVYFDDALKDVRGYQLHTAVLGGKHGQLELVDMTIHNRRDVIFDREWEAFNRGNSQLVVGMDSAGVPTQAGAYLATFTYRVSRDAAGTFMVDMLHDNSDPTQRTFLFPTPTLSKIEVTGTTPAVFTVVSAKGRRLAERTLQ